MSLHYPYIEAEYESGYILREDDVDHSPYDAGKNVFNAILNFRPCEAHGKMVRFSLVFDEQDTYTIDWTKVPDGARPIRFKHMEGTFIDGGLVDKRIVGIDFGYQWVDEDGRKQEIVEHL